MPPPATPCWLMSMVCDFGELVERHGLFEVRSMAATKAEHLRLPHRGRRIHPEDRERLLAECEREADLLIVLGDGLSATAVARQAPVLFERLAKDAAERNWKLARPFLVRNCRVGILNEIGDLLAPAVLVLLIGERPGLATAESLSAYLAYRPRTGHTDADRNLISNIHPQASPRTTQPVAFSPSRTTCGIISEAASVSRKRITPGSPEPGVR